MDFPPWNAYCLLETLGMSERAGGLDQADREMLARTASSVLEHKALPAEPSEASDVTAVWSWQRLLRGKVPFAALDSLCPPVTEFATSDGAIVPVPITHEGLVQAWRLTGKDKLAEAATLPRTAKLLLPSQWAAATVAPRLGEAVHFVDFVHPADLVRALDDGALMFASELPAPLFAAHISWVDTPQKRELFGIMLQRGGTSRAAVMHLLGRLKARGMGSRACPPFWEAVCVAVARQAAAGGSDGIAMATSLVHVLASAPRSQTEADAGQREGVPMEMWFVSDKQWGIAARLALACCPYLVALRNTAVLDLLATHLPLVKGQSEWVAEALRLGAHGTAAHLALAGWAVPADAVQLAAQTGREWAEVVMAWARGVEDPASKLTLAALFKAATSTKTHGSTKAALAPALAVRCAAARTRMQSWLDDVESDDAGRDFFDGVMGILSDAVAADDVESTRAWFDLLSPDVPQIGDAAGGRVVGPVDLSATYTGTASAAAPPRALRTAHPAVATHLVTRIAASRAVRVAAWADGDFGPFMDGAVRVMEARAAVTRGHNGALATALWGSAACRATLARDQAADRDRVVATARWLLSHGAAVTEAAVVGAAQGDYVELIHDMAAAGPRSAAALLGTCMGAMKGPRVIDVNVRHVKAPTFGVRSSKSNSAFRGVHVDEPAFLLALAAKLSFETRAFTLGALRAAVTREAADAVLRHAFDVVPNVVPDDFAIDGDEDAALLPRDVLPPAVNIVRDSRVGDSEEVARERQVCVLETNWLAEHYLAAAFSAYDWAKEESAPPRLNFYGMETDVKAWPWTSKMYGRDALGLVYPQVATAIVRAAKSPTYAKLVPQEDDRKRVRAATIGFIRDGHDAFCRAFVCPKARDALADAMTDAMTAAMGAGGTSQAAGAGAAGAATPDCEATVVSASEAAVAI